MMERPININNTNFILHPNGVVFWKKRKILLIADVHLGKVAHFRKYGAAVPQNASNSNFEKLDAVVTYFKPKQIIFLGDLFHSKLNNDWTAFKLWAQKHSVILCLVSGNHDIIPGYLFEEVGIKVFDELILDEFLLTHHPEERKNYFNFCGHVHPGVRLTGPGRQTLKLSCFYRTKGQLILPAFGTFTGKYILSPSKNDQIYAIIDNEVVEIPLKN